jgi:hypothetical protein
MIARLLFLVCIVAGVVSSQSLPVRKEIPAIASARDYYTQLYDAGGFARSIQQYVCFNDDAKEMEFFTFATMAYDERYAKAYQSFNEQPTTPDKQQEAWHTMKSLQEVVPYLDFLDDVLLSVFPPKAQAYLRQGGRLLEASFYRKGVKSGEVEYQWEGQSWVVQEAPDASAYVKTMKTFRLSIEPATLRYIEQVTITDTVGSGQTQTTESHIEESQLGSGMCEKIPEKRPN